MPALGDEDVGGFDIPMNDARRSYVDSTGRKVTRFGFHNIRKAVSDYLTEGKKADVRTIQDTLRHENPEMTLSKYTESSLESRLAAQDVMASAVLGDSTRVQ